MTVINASGSQWVTDQSLYNFMLNHKCMYSILLHCNTAAVVPMTSNYCIL